MGLAPRALGSPSLFMASAFFTEVLAALGALLFLRLALGVALEFFPSGCGFLALTVESLEAAVSVQPRLVTAAAC